MNLLVRTSSSEILVLIAALNEEEGIGLTIAELKTVLDDPSILVVDGDSSDKTAEVAKEYGAEVWVQRDTGKGGYYEKASKKSFSMSLFVTNNPDVWDCVSSHFDIRIEILS